LIASFHIASVSD